MIKIGIIDYGVGNLGSVQNAFEFIKSHSNIAFQAYIESSPDKLKDYDKLLLPGVGAFGNAMTYLEGRGLKEAVIAFAKSGKYLLGICLGMQLLFERSYEFGEHKGLGLLEGEVRAFSCTLKVPHVGWNSCTFSPKGLQSPLLTNIANDSFFYFVHSFHICAKPELILAYCDYGYKFGAIVNKDNLFGIQPHPEKSHEVGLKLIENFIAI